MNLTLEVGLVHRRNIREALKEFKFNGHLVDYIERKGWFVSTFMLKGLSAPAAALIQKYIADISTL